MSKDQSTDPRVRALGKMLAEAYRQREESECLDVSRFWQAPLENRPWSDDELNHLRTCATCSARRAEVAVALGQDANTRIVASPESRHRLSKYWASIVAVAASLLFVSLILLVRDKAIAIENEKKRVQEKLIYEQALRKADGEQARIFARMELIHNYLALSNIDRRHVIRPLLEEVIKLRNALPPEIDRDRIDTEIRSINAAALAFPTVRVADGNTFPLAKHDDSAFLTHPAAILPDGSGMAIATKKRPYFWKRGAPPDWPATLNAKEDFDGTDRSPRVEYSPDGSILAFAPQIEGGLTLWDRECTRAMRTLIPSGGPGNLVLAIGFSPDSKRLFAVRADGTVPSWKLPNGEADIAWPLANKPATVAAARFSADNAWLALADGNGSVSLFGADGKAVATLACGDKVRVLAWSHDNQMIAAGLRSGAIIAFDRSGVHRYTKPNYQFGESYRLQFSPDGRFLLTGARSQGGRMFDARTGDMLATSEFGVWSLSKDGKWFAGSDGMLASFVEFVAPTAVRRFGGRHNTIAHIGWSKDSLRVVTLDWNFVIRILDVTKANAGADALVRQFQEERNVGGFATAAHVALSADGKQLCYARGGWEKNYIQVRDIKSGAELGRWDLPGGDVRVAAIGPNRFVSVSEEVEEVTAKGRKRKSVARVFEVGMKEPVSVKVLRKSEATDVGSFLAHWLTPDGKLYATSGPRFSDPPGRRRAEVYDVETGNPITRIPVNADDGGTPSVMLSPDGKYLWFSRKERETSRLFRVTLNDPNPPVEVADLPYGIAPDFTHVAVSSRRSGPLKQLDLDSWSDGRHWLHFSNLDQSDFYGEGQTYSPDGRFLAFGSQSGMLTLVDLTELKKEIEKIEKLFQKTGG